MTHDDPTAAMRATNARQAAYYDRPAPLLEADSAFTRLWARAKRRLYGSISREAGIAADGRALHRAWMADLAGRRVLDVGCFDGSPLSLWVAEQSAGGYYLAVDLSPSAIARYREKLANAGAQGRPVAHAEARAVDVLDLTPEAAGGAFDVVYAASVLHHFADLAAALRHLRGLLRPGGVIVAWDPLATSLPNRLLRAVYRPFQGDADWEWPFTQATFAAVRAAGFAVEGVQGLFGRSKWAIPLRPILGAERAIRLARRWHAYDLAAASREGPALWACTNVLLLLRRVG